MTSPDDVAPDGARVYPTSRQSDTYVRGLEVWLSWDDDAASLAYEHTNEEHPLIKLTPEQRALLPEAWVTDQIEEGGSMDVGVIVASLPGAPRRRGHPDDEHDGWDGSFDVDQVKVELEDGPTFWLTAEQVSETRLENCTNFHDNLFHEVQEQGE